ncbi:MAG TPA: MmcQ/YjbR family DNA-binding protein [Candidatus Binatia bacterium]|nr:MmcQ/YjbR family DNA-binding protein [Candidatus Binatia bacterium]
MDIEAIRRYCLGFPHTTENMQWGSDLCFKVDGKLFVVTALEPGPVRLSFKCTPESFAELCERPGIRPAPYMARAQWVSLEQLNSLPDAELRELIAESYRLVWERLPKMRREELQAAEGNLTGKTKASNPTSKTTKKRLTSKKKAAGAGRQG